MFRCEGTAKNAASDTPGQPRWAGREYQGSKGWQGLELDAGAQLDEARRQYIRLAVAELAIRDRVARVIEVSTLEVQRPPVEAITDAGVIGGKGWYRHCVLRIEETLADIAQQHRRCQTVDRHVE